MKKTLSYYSSGRPRKKQARELARVFFMMRDEK